MRIGSAGRVAGTMTSSRRRSGALAPKPLLSVEETAELLGQSRSSLYRAIERGDLPLPLYTISGRYRIPRAAVERLLAGEAPSPTASPAGPRAAS